MLSSKIENSVPVLGSLWFPGKKPEGGFVVAPLSARAQEIAKSREDLLGILRDLPESDYELSLTDLVEKVSDSAAAANPDEPEDTSQPALNKDRSPRHRRRSTSSSDGVLLNMYMPNSLSRSLTSRSSRCSSRSSSRRATSDGIKRDREPPALLSCWSAIWDKGRGKSRKT